MEWYFGNMEMDCNLKRTELVIDFVFYFERSRTHELQFKSFIQIVQGFHYDIDEAVVPWYIASQLFCHWRCTSKRHKLISLKCLPHERIQLPNNTSVPFVCFSLTTYSTSYVPGTSFASSIYTGADIQKPGAPAGTFRYPTYGKDIFGWANGNFIAI